MPACETSSRKVVPFHSVAAAASAAVVVVAVPCVVHEKARSKSSTEMQTQRPTTQLNSTHLKSIQANRSQHNTTRPSRLWFSFFLASSSSSLPRRPRAVVCVCLSVCLPACLSVCPLALLFFIERSAPSSPSLLRSFVRSFSKSFVCPFVPQPQAPSQT
jgi:hypothetical protein